MNEQFTENELKAIVSILSTISGLNPLTQLAVDALVKKAEMILAEKPTEA